MRRHRVILPLRCRYVRAGGNPKNESPMKTTITTIDSDQYMFNIIISAESGEGFSIVARGKNRSGCLHEEILRYRPDLKCFVDLHLSYIDGQPLHSEENGWYWLAKAADIPQRFEPRETKEMCLNYLAQHCRISKLEAEIIVSQIQKKYSEGSLSVAQSEHVSPYTEIERNRQGVIHARNEWKKIMNGMRPRWKTEAENALTLLETLV